MRIKRKKIFGGSLQKNFLVDFFVFKVMINKRDEKKRKESEKELLARIVNFIRKKSQQKKEKKVVR